MTGTLIRTAWLAAIYLLVISSVEAEDVAVAVVLGLAVAVGLGRHGASHPDTPPLRQRVLAAAGLVLSTAAEVVRGTWRTMRFCLGEPGRPGFVEIPRGDRSAGRVALWGVLTGEAPDEYPVDVDEERDVLVVHLLDASDPDAVRARHARTDERWYRRVVR